eukprot:3610898-Prymnesium_polylepis.1
MAVEVVLKAMGRHYDKVYQLAIRAWKTSKLSGEVLDGFVVDFRPKLDRGWTAGDDSIECVVMSLAALFIEKPEKWGAFAQ